MDQDRMAVRIRLGNGPNTDGSAPPGRFSMMMVWPTLAATCSNTVRGSRSVALPGANGTTTWTRLLGQTLAAEVWGAEVWGAEVSAVSGPIIIHTDAVAAIAASAADPHAFHLCTLSPSCAAPRHATSPTGGHASLADRFSHHHRQGDGPGSTCTSVPIPKFASLSAASFANFGIEGH